MGLSDLIAGHIAHAPTPPERALAAARLALLDALGVMLAASGMSAEAAPFAALAVAEGGGPCRLLGRPERVTLQSAAFANGALAHALDFEDAFDPAPCHPNAALVPALLALAEARGAGIDDLLGAMAIGCDLTCRMALALRRPMEEGGWYPPPILGAMGAAAGAARLLRLDAAQTRSALSLALCQATAPGEIKYSAATTIRAVREAFPARAAVTAALLAQAGVVGFEAPIEGRAGFYRLFAQGDFEEAVLLDSLGETFHGEALSFKRWPACRGTHAYIEGALRLRAQLAGRRVRQIEVIVGDVQRMLVEPAARKQAPATAIDAKFSIFHTVARALVHGEVGLGDFDEAARGDPAVRDLAARMVARHDPVQVPTAVGGIIRIDCEDGQSLSENVPIPAGHPSRPLARAEMVAKFVACAAMAATPLPAPAAQALAERILAPNAGGAVSDLLCGA